MNLADPHRYGGGALWRPSELIDAVAKRSRWDAVPLGNGIPRAAGRVAFDDAPIGGLRASGDPCAIGRPIAAVHIDPLDGQSMRVTALDCPGAKGCEIAPADVYSSATVVRESFGLGVSAPLQHPSPDAVEEGSITAMSARQAPAGCGQPSPQARGLYGLLAAAIAKAIPSRGTILARRFGYDDPPSEPSASQVDQCFRGGRLVAGSDCFGGPLCHHDWMAFQL